MASTNFTTHYSIPLPLGTDLTTPMDYNEAAEAVDTALFAAETDAGNASEAAAAAVTTANAAADAVDTLSGDLSQEKAKIVALTTRVTNAENEIDDVRADSSDMITAYNEPTATASHNYAIGDFFIYNNTLYKATAAIAIGATIVPDTNCETTNVSTELIEIKSALTNTTLTTSVSGLSFTKEPSSGDITIDFNNVNLGSIGYSDWNDIITNIPSDYCPSHSIYLPLVVSTVTYSLYLTSGGTLSIRPQDSQSHTLNNVMTQVTYRK